MPDNAERLMVLFEGFSGAHGTHGVPSRAPDSLKWEIKKTADTKREPVTIRHWRDHLAGKRPLGIITIREDGMCKWGSIDYDVYDANLLELIAKAEKLKLPLVPVRSKSGGLHLFLFLVGWVSAAAVQTALRDMAAQLGVSGSEIYPKQTQVLTEKGGLGNWIIMPYFGDTYGGKIQEQVGLKKTGAEMLVGEFLTLAEKTLVGEEELAKLTRKRGSSSAGGGGRKQNHAAPAQDPDAPFGDGPPCLQTLAEDGVPRGMQNNALLHMGVYYKRRDPVGWKENLEEAGREYLNPPSTAEGMASVISSLEKKDYQYTCKAEPMCSHCNVALCRTRQFGIGEEGDYPVISSLSRLESEPPLFFLAIEGHGTVQLDTMQLYTYAHFQRACMAQKIGQCFRAMKQSDWLEVVNSAMTRMESIEVPPDAGESGRFRELLEEFCTNRQRGNVLEDLFSGRPWQSEEDKRHYFRLKDLQAFLVREGVRDMDRGKIAQRLRDMQGDHHFFNLKGRGLRCWSVAASEVEAAPEISTPRKEEAGI